MATDHEANIETDPKKDKTVNDNSQNIEAKQHNDGERRQGGKRMMRERQRPSQLDRKKRNVKDLTQTVCDLGRNHKQTKKGMTFSPMPHLTIESITL